MSPQPLPRYFPHLAGSLILASASLLGFLGKWEGGSEYTVYADKLAGGLPTVCRGLTRNVTSTPIIVSEYWGPEKCAREEQAALVKIQTQLGQCFKRLPPQGVFDMASSHAWNNGPANTCGSLAVKAFNAGQWELGCQRLSVSDSGKPVWSFVSRINAKGQREYIFVKGLGNRRSDETANCLQFLKAANG